MNLWNRQAGTWKAATGIFAKVAGTWTPVKKVFFNIAGTWTQAYQQSGGTPTFSNHSFAASPGATFYLGNDGRAFWIETGSTTQYFAGEWLSSAPTSPTIAAAYEVVFTYVSGPNTHSGTTNGGGSNKAGDAYDVALNLGTTRGINMSAFAGTITGSGSGTLVFDVHIYPAGGGSAIAAGRVTIFAST